MDYKLVIEEAARTLSHPYKDVIESIENGENVLSRTILFEWQMKYGRVTFKVDQINDQLVLSCMVNNPPVGDRYQRHIVARIDHHGSVVEKFFEKVLINPVVQMTDSEKMVWMTEFVRRRKEALSKGSEFPIDRAIQDATQLVHDLREVSRRYEFGDESVLLRQMLNPTD